MHGTIRLEGTDKTYSGKMVNISANGFAFSVRDNVFASQKGRNVQLDVKDFAVIGNKPADRLRDPKLQQ